jgi:hypothetical protein
MQYTQLKAETSVNHIHHKPGATQQTQRPQQRTPNHNHKQQVRSKTHFTVNGAPTKPIEHHQYTSTFPALPILSDPHWQTVEYEKRPRDVPETHTQNNKQIKLHDYWLNPPPPQTTKRFDALADDDQEHGGEKPPNKLPKPPPIFVAGVQNIKPLNELLVATSGDNFELKVLSGNQVKVQPKSAEHYRQILHALIDKRTEFHTYQPKEERCFHTVLRGMHYSTDVADIKSATERYGHTVLMYTTSNNNGQTYPCHYSSLT